MIQGDQEWIGARLGKVTASRVADVIAKTRTGWGASRANYMAELLVERLTGAPAERYTNAAMQWGADNEGDARTAYEFYANAAVEVVGFLDHPTIPMAGASPDGFVGAAGLVEIKAPNSATHLETLLGGRTPEKYVTQMQFQMAVTGRQWCDWVSFDPRMPEHLRLVIRHVDRDDKLIVELEKEVRHFLMELDEKITRLRTAVVPKAVVMAALKQSVLMAG